MVSLYDFNLSKSELFETLLTHSDAAMEEFCPAPKCVSLVRVSRTGTVLAAHEEYNNMLKNYELLHGTKIGILVRDEDNLYFGWTDEERIDLPDDFFLTPGEKIVSPNERKNQENMSDDMRWEKTMHVAREFASRYYIFSILQGIVDSETPLLYFPEETNMFMASPYVVFSSADNWIDDNRFGSFGEIIKKCNETIMVGDPILTFMSLAPEFKSRYHRNENSRGRGYANRTHDCYVPDCEILPINQIDEKHSYYHYYRYKEEALASHSRDGFLVTAWSKEAEPPERQDGIYDHFEDEVRYDYFVSVAKGSSLP